MADSTVVTTGKKYKAVELNWRVLEKATMGGDLELELEAGGRWAGRETSPLFSLLQEGGLTLFPLLSVALALPNDSAYSLYPWLQPPPCTFFFYVVF